MQRGNLTLFGKDQEAKFEETISADYTFEEATVTLDKINWDFTIAIKPMFRHPDLFFILFFFRR